MNSKVIELRNKMANAVKAIDMMREAEDFFGGLMDKKSQSIIAESKKVASKNIAEVGLCLDTLVATIDNMEAVATAN